jgi:hypothetical protein
MKTAQAQNIFHGNVVPDKYVRSRVRTASDQPVTEGEPLRTPPASSARVRSKKRSTKRRLRQLATWVEDPIVFKIQQKARAKKMSMSATIRSLLITVLREDDDTIDAALAPEMIEASVARAVGRIVSGLVSFLVRHTFELGQVKALSTNTLAMQEGVTEEVLKDIREDADRRTRASLSRKNPKLADISKAVEAWILDGATDEAPMPDGQVNGRKEGAAA